MSNAEQLQRLGKAYGCGRGTQGSGELRHARSLGAHPCYLGPREHVPNPSSARKNADILFAYTKDDHFSSLAGKTGGKS